MTVEDIILKYQQKGVHLYLKDKKLYFDAPKGIIDEKARKEISDWKNEIIHYLKYNDYEVVINKEGIYTPFKLTDIQAAYMVGSNESYSYGGIGCKIYCEIKYPKLDLVKLQNAWNQVIDNNDMLHAKININGTQQILDNYILPKIKFWEMEDSKERIIDEHLKNIKERLSTKKYEIGEWPLYDLEVTNLKDSSILHLSLDMMIADFMSIKIIFEELESYYFEGKAKVNKELSYRDIIVYYENKKMNPNIINKYNKDEEYWKNRINSLPEAPVLPIKENSNKFSIKQYNEFINKKRKIELEKMCKEYGITVSSFILGVYTEVLRYWSQQKNFCINVTISDREDIHPEVKTTIGDFTVVNILEISDEYKLSFIERVKKIQLQLWNDMEHSSYSGVEVLREMSRARNKKVVIPYVYTSALGIQDNNEFEKISKYGELIYKISQTPQVLIDCQAIQYKDGILVNWDVRENDFPDGLIDSAFEVFSNILKNLEIRKLINDKNIINLPNSLRKNRNKINDTYKNFERRTLVKGFCDNVKSRPEAEAISFNGVSYSYSDLADYVLTVQNELIKRGCKPGDIVAIHLNKGIWQIAATLGALMVGAIYLPIDINQPISRIDRICSDSKARFVLTSLNNRLGQKIYSNEICKVYIENLKVSKGLEIKKVGCNPDDIAYVIYTSGSTGNPKGVVITHKAAMNTINDIIQRFNITEKDRVICISNLAFDLSVFDIFGILTAGGTLIMPSDNKNVSEWNYLLKKEKVTIWNTAPAQMQMITSYLESEKINGSDSLRVVMLSGDWIPLSLPNKIKSLFKNSRIISLGGATEASIWSIFHEIDIDNNYKRSITYGTPLANQQFYVLDSNLNECPDWVRGTLYIGGKGLANGYLNDRDLTAQKFIFHNNLGKRLYNTGDCGRYYPNGDIEFLGREDGQVKIRGNRVELNEIEAILNTFPGIANSTVVISGENDDIIGAFIQPDISSYCKESNVNQRIRTKNELLFKNKEKHGIVKQFNEWIEASNNTAILDILKTFQSIGIFTDFKIWHTENEIINKIGIKSSYISLLRRWLKVLENERIIEKNEEDGYKAIMYVDGNEADNEWAKWTKLEEKVHYSEVMMKYFSESRKNLIPLLRGEIDPIELFFPGGKFDIALEAYKYNKVNSFMNKTIIDNIKLILDDFMKIDSKNKFKILEVGAGVGGVSQELIESIKEYPVEYMFTDISQSFLNFARSNFKQYPWVEFQLYDINRNYWEQNINSSSYDLILCNNVLHNASDLLRVMKQIKEMVKPNGYIVILEETENNYTLLTSVEFLNGFNNVKDFRNENNQVFLDKNQWGTIIEKIGGNIVSILPKINESLNGFGQTLFVIQIESKIKSLNENKIKSYLKQNLPEYMIPNHIEILKELPITVNGKIDRKALMNRVKSEKEEVQNKTEKIQLKTDLEKRVAEIWKLILKRRDIYANENFYEIGGDSLVAAQLVAQLKENIVEAKEWPWDKLMVALIESPTIGGLCKRLIEKQSTMFSKKENKMSGLIYLKEDPNSSITRVLIHDGTGTINPYDKLIPLMKELDGDLVVIICDNTEKYLSIKSDELIQTLGIKYAKKLIESSEKDFELIGFCIGGLIALETAKVLSENGKKVARLISIDTTPSKKMIYNELLMERAFGMIIGSNVYRAGHMVEDFELKKAILSLGEKYGYGSVISNEELLVMKEEFNNVIKCYEKLALIDKKERFKKIYSNIYKYGDKNIIYNEEQLPPIYEVFCHSFKAMISYNPGVYFGKTVILDCSNQKTTFLPIDDCDNELFWKNVIIGESSRVRIEGNHLTCLQESYVKNVFHLLYKEM